LGGGNLAEGKGKSNYGKRGRGKQTVNFNRGGGDFKGK